MIIMILILCIILLLLSISLWRYVSAINNNVVFVYKEVQKIGKG